MVDVQGSFLPHLIGDVGIGVQGRGRRDMADDGGKGHDIHPVLQGQGGKSVAQVMKSYPFAPCPLQNYLQSLADIAGINRLLRLGAGREHQFREDTLFVLRQQLHHGGRQDNGAVGRLGLGFADNEFATHGIDLFVNVQFSGGKIQVIPPEGQQLAPAHAGGQFQEKEFVHPLRLGLN